MSKSRDNWANLRKRTDGLVRLVRYKVEKADWFLQVREYHLVNKPERNSVSEYVGRDVFVLFSN